MKWLPRILLTAFVCSLLAGAQARAQVKFVKPTGDIVRDIEASKAATAAAKASPGASSSSDQPFTCDVSLFTKLTPANVVSAIKNCVGDAVNGIAKPLADDLQDSLDSATTAKDGTAIACYTPALALARAAQGTPAVPAVKDASGNITTPEVPARPPGPILIFQKYREFVNAGGPSNCKTTVQGTINGTVAAAL